MRKKKAFNQNFCNYCIFEMYIINVRNINLSRKNNFPKENITSKFTSNFQFSNRDEKLKKKKKKKNKEQRLI